MSIIITASDKAKYNALMDTVEANTKQPSFIFVVNNTDSSLAPRPTMSKTIFKIFDQHYHVSPNSAMRLGFRYTSDSDLISVLDDDKRISKYYLDAIRIASNHNPHASVFCPQIAPCVTHTQASVQDTYEKIEDPQDCLITIRGDLLREVPAIPSPLTTYFANEWLFFWTRTVWNRPWVRVKNALASCIPCGTTQAIELREKEKEIFDTIISDL